jgi:hypothetical protein
MSEILLVPLNFNVIFFNSNYLIIEFSPYQILNQQDSCWNLKQVKAMILRNEEWV